MATVRSLTAERMLEIEAASVVDGEIVGEDLILTKHDGSTINAGVVRGAEGPIGPAGLDLASLPLVPALDTGMSGQIRAGRALTLADFSTLLGLPSVPVGLFNLSDLTNLGTGGALADKGGVAFGPGILGASAEAAKFNGETTKALYIADTGSGDPFRIKTGTVGCWFKSYKLDTNQMLVAKYGASGARSWELYVGSGNVLTWVVSTDGAGAGPAITGTTPIVDDRWHFAVGTYDGHMLKMYVDGILEDDTPYAGSMFGSTTPFNIGSRLATATVAAELPLFGTIDEVFVTPDVLSEDQVRLLYCAKRAHGFTVAPKHIILNTRRRRRGVNLEVADFPTQPLRLYNLDTLADLGSNNVPLTANPGTGSIVQFAGPEGAKDTARSYLGGHTGDSGTTAGLPAGTSAITMGAWFKTNNAAAITYFMSYGDSSTERYLAIRTDGTLAFGDISGNTAGGPIVNDGLWHFGVMTIDPAAAGGIFIKAYLDGKYISRSGSALQSIVLGGANFFRIGARRNGTSPFIGQIARAFVHDAVLTREQIMQLYVKSGQELGLSPKATADHVEAFDAENVYAVFDNVEPQDRIDMAVAV